MLTDAEPKKNVKLANILFERLPDTDLIKYCIFEPPDCILSYHKSILLLEHSVHNSIPAPKNMITNSI